MARSSRRPLARASVLRQTLSVSGQAEDAYWLVVLLGMAWFGIIGLMDDLAKMRAKSGDRGLSESRKLMLQALFAAAVAIFLAMWMAFFHVRALSEPSDNIVVRVGAALKRLLNLMGVSAPERM